MNLPLAVCFLTFLLVVLAAIVVHRAAAPSRIAQDARKEHLVQISLEREGEDEVQVQ